ncbi:hypothetical protein C1645_841432 [Glomus cerebriforme]|uniref:Uncharacterized protein n=1 Tax=Glomus cerebriforme TaxID=658196 RepID=A0A397RY13_9GLOM|nr:hypothetical protein C1645_841432 [Glomus cerebriforme]
MSIQKCNLFCCWAKRVFRKRSLVIFLFEGGSELLGILRILLISVTYFSVILGRSFWGTWLAGRIKVPVPLVGYHALT